jgi:hypothetical protein
MLKTKFPQRIRLLVPRGREDASTGGEHPCSAITKLATNVDGGRTLGIADHDRAGPHRRSHPEQGAGSIDGLPAGACAFGSTTWRRR